MKYFCCGIQLEVDDLLLQYIIYDWNSLLADIGGYLGLLVGQSIFGMYQLFASWMNWSKVSRLLKTRGKRVKAVKDEASMRAGNSPLQSVIHIKDMGNKANPPNSNDKVSSIFASRVMEDLLKGIPSEQTSFSGSPHHD